MSKFNLFEPNYNLAAATTRRPPVVTRRQPVITARFAAGVGLWFTALFALGFMVMAFA
jgi:hypothetical protein